MAEVNLKWYILKTKTNYEARAKKMIEDVIKNKSLEEEIEEVLIPEKEVIQVLKGKKVTRLKKIYPGYIFVKMKLTPELAYTIKNVSNVSHFVGNKLEPLEVPKEQLQNIGKQIEEGVRAPETVVSFTEGDTVLVIDGPFKNFNGQVEEVNHEKGRVKVSVKIFGRPTPVDVDFAQVHKEN